MASETIVDGLYKDFSAILNLLDEAGEVSLRSVANENFRKVLLTAAASRFERSMMDAILDFVKQTTTENHPLTWLIKNKVVDRQYHTWFNWEARNANRFFGLFGKNFQNNMEEKVKNNDELDSSIKAFLEIGRERNRLVHDDFGSFSLEKTYEEIYNLYTEAALFVEWLPEALKTFAEKEVPG